MRTFRYIFFLILVAAVSVCMALPQRVVASGATGGAGIVAESGGRKKSGISSAYQAEILTALADTGIRQLSPGGKARAFADIVAHKMGELETRQFLNLQDTLLPFATGPSLDSIGELFGVYRLEQEDARVEADDQNFRFWVRTGTFGDLNNGNDISIPANVQITTDAPNGPVYLTRAVVLPAAASEQSVGAVSLYTGAQGNVPAGVFTRHNFTDYTESAYGALLVRNDFGITGGREKEDDESYRYRIALRLQSRSGINEAALRYELLQLPGIQDVVFVPQAGTFLVYVYGIAPVVAPSLLALAQQRINERAAYPLTGTVVSPDLVGISLATTITLSRSAAAGDKDIVVRAAQTAAENYINNLRIGEPLVINEVADRIRNADARIIDVGEPNKQIPEIFLWRSRNDGSRYSRFLVANYAPKLGERVVPVLRI